jgi:hypothetical protein
MTKEQWQTIAEFQQKFYPTWLSDDKPRLLFSNALAGEVGEVCGVITHLDGGGTNNRKYTERMVLHQCVDSYVQLALLVMKSGFTYSDFEKEFWNVMSELYDRLEQKVLVAIEELNAHSNVQNVVRI